MSDHPDHGPRRHDHLVEPMFAALGGGDPGPGAGKRPPPEEPDVGPGRLAGPATALLAGLGVGLALVRIVLWTS